MLSGGGRGQEVHAGSRIPAREMVLDSALLDRPREFARIFLHEVFHFIWVRLGNPVRQSYEAVLLKERCAGELGWSAEMRKLDLEPPDIEGRTSRWREYACESFCDTGSWFCTRIPRHSEWTLPRNARDRRRRWFTAFLSREALRF